MGKFSEVQELLLDVNKDCIELSTSVSLHFDNPTCGEIKQTAEKLKEKLEKYLNQLIQN